MLTQSFGDVEKKAEAYIKKGLLWQTIKPEDGTALETFALFLTGCSNMMTIISYMEDLDNTANMKALAYRLPYKLKETSGTYACNLQEIRRKE